MGDITGLTFDEQQVPPIHDAILYQKLLMDGILKGCEITSSGANLTVAAGHIIACGRVMQLPSAVTKAIDGATSGYARVKIKIDLTEEATASTFDQAAFVVEYAATNSFTALTQEDINASGTVYEFELCRVSLDAGGIDAVVSKVTALNLRLNAGSLNPNPVNVLVDKTLSLDDVGRLQLVYSSSPVTITIPPYSSVPFPVGTKIEILRYGTGTVTIAAGAGVTIHSPFVARTISAQYAKASIVDYAAANIWTLDGAIG